MKSNNQFGSSLFYRDEGKGSPVILLHSSASSGRQWDDLAEQLKQRRRVIAPDLPGYGRSREIGSGGTGSLNDEVEAVFSLIEPLEEPVDLIGHSFGAAVALKVALRWPARVKSLTLIEPVLFHLLRQDDVADRSLLWEIKLLSSRIVSSILDRAPARGMQQFVDFWNGEGSWSQLNSEARDSLAQRIGQVQNNFVALCAETWSVDLCRDLLCPVLAIAGDQSVAATQRITSLLVEALPNVTLRSIKEAGHMAPVTHGAEVNGLILEHLAEDDASEVIARPSLQTAA